MDGNPYPGRFVSRERRKAWFKTRTALAVSSLRYNFYHYARYHAFVFSRELYRKNKGVWPVAATTQHALRLQTHSIKLTWPNLPAHFDGYRILHLADLRLDHMDDTAKTVAACATHHGNFDLCVITGDLRDDVRFPCDQTIERLETIRKAARARDGILCVLGNHDGPELVAPLEALGVNVLLNETVSLPLGNDHLHLTGLDDVQVFHTYAATKALRQVPEGFAIALVHSPEIADIASERHMLYLTGHTHRGQICTFGGRAISIALRSHRGWGSGLWRHDDMIGYTSRGAGTSGIPVRLNCPGEVSVITLKRGRRAAMINDLIVDLRQV